MSWSDDCNKKAWALTKEKRQEVLDLMHKGKNLGEAAELCGIDSDTVVGIVNINIKTYSGLRTESL